MLKHPPIAALVALPLLLAAACGTAPTPPGTKAPPNGAGAASLTGRVVAVGLGGATAVSPVGRFHAGGPIHDKPEFAAFTQAGEVLSPERILVTSDSNFGAPLAATDRPAGSVLSIDPRGPDPLVVPPTFASSGAQATAADGRIRLYTAQSPAFVNRLTTPGAVTADRPAVSLPLGISINNAFGRPWFANAPLGPSGVGTETIVDPDGRPLAGAPNPVAGGVFEGTLTNRGEPAMAGSVVGATGTALMGRSPDRNGKAVFAVVNGDGSLAQVHAQEGVDGLAPAGTVRALPSDGSLRAGAVFNWTPDKALLVADPVGNGVVLVALGDDGKIFRVDSVRRLEGAHFATPVDLAPAVPEVANPEFSSNTTLAGASDVYVLNRGNGTIARLRQDGQVVAVRTVHVNGSGAVGGGRLNGIAVSPDAQRIWVSVAGTLAGYGDAPGAVLELPAFGA